MGMLLSTIDDVESVTISRAENIRKLAQENLLHLLHVLRYPSLRALDLAGVVIETMDLFDPSVHDPRLPRKPLLEKLHLDDMTLDDLSSMDRFFRILQDTSHCKTAPNPLAKTLTDLKIGRSAGSVALYALDDSAAQMLDALLHTNRVLQQVDVVLRIDDASTAFKNAVRLFAHSRTTHHVPFSFSERRSSAIHKARNLAFLSVTTTTGRTSTGRSTSALGLLDVSVVGLILEFSGPHVHRNVSVELTNEGAEEE